MPLSQAIRIKMGAGDTAPDLILTCQNLAGLAVAGAKPPLNIAGYTVKLVIRRPAPSTPLIKTGIITDAANGVVVFGWLTTDLVAGLRQPAEVQMTDTNGRTSTFTGIQFDVSPDLAAPTTPPPSGP